MVDEVGRKLDEKTVAATSDGYLQAVAWAGQWSARSWALEDCRHLTRRLEGDLLDAGEAVMRVPARLRAGAREGSRQRAIVDTLRTLCLAPAAEVRAAFEQFADCEGEVGLGLGSEHNAFADGRNVRWLGPVAVDERGLRRACVLEMSRSSWNFGAVQRHVA